MRLKRKTKSKYFVGITHTKRKFIINPEHFDTNNILSRLFIQNLKQKSNMVQDLSRKMKIAFKNIYWRTVPNSKYKKYYASLARMVKQNTVKGHMQKTKLYQNQFVLVMLLSSMNHNYTI